MGGYYLNGGYTWIHAGRRRLLDAMRRHPQLPGLGTSIARIVAMADSNAESIQELRNVILADVYLTQRILGIANSAGYRLNSGAGITTVTRAIVVIGFEQVKLLALGMLFVDQLPDKERAVALKAELIQALQASLLAREMSRQLAPDDKEKAAIAALLGNVAKLLLVMIDLDRFREISRRVVNGATEASAAQDVLGMSLQTLTNEVLISWGIPDALVSLGTGTITPADAKKIHRLDRIVALAKTTAQHLRHRHGAEITKACPQTTSFIILPILSENSPIACILVGRDLPEPEPISPEDMRLLRTVRGQIILAMKTIR